MQHRPKTSHIGDPVHAQESASVQVTSINEKTHNFSFSELKTLAALPPALTASVYLPTHRVPALRHQDHTRLKQLLHEARLLLSTSVGEAQAVALLSPALAELDQPEFWNHPGNGLVLFCRGDGFRHRWTSATLPELALVSQHCHLKPLLPLLQDDGHFYVLELTQHGVHLHAGSRFSWLPVQLLEAPAAVAEAPNRLDPEHHTGVRTLRQGDHGAIRHFGTSGDEHAKGRVTDFFRLVDHSVCAALHGHREPLIIAGVDYLLPLYRGVNHYTQVLPSGLGGNADLVPEATLHERAWEMVKPYLGKASADARARFPALLQRNGLASDDLSTVVRASFHGRLADLFVAGDRERWGTYDSASDVLVEHGQQLAGDEDLLNLAIIAAFRTHANVQVLPWEMMPNQGTVAANFRY